MSDTRRDYITHIVEDMEIEGQFLAGLIYTVHKDDTGKTEADWAGMGAIWRNKDQKKSVETCRMHLGRCGSCWERLQAIFRRYKKRPSGN